MSIVKYSEGSIEKVIKVENEEDENELNKKMSEAKKEEKDLNKEAKENEEKVPFWTK